MRYLTVYKKTKKPKEGKPSKRRVLGIDSQVKRIRPSQEHLYDKMLHIISDKYGHELASSVDKKLKRAIHHINDYFSDSYRVYEGGCDTGKKLFEKAKSCCGNYEAKISINNRTFYIGFNYGH